MRCQNGDLRAVSYNCDVSFLNLRNIFQVKAVAHLRELHLCRVELSTEQLVSLLESCIAASGKFEEVNLSAMDLSQVE